MKIKVTLRDWSEWEGHPKDFHQVPVWNEQPDPHSNRKGIERMLAITDDGRITEFAYDDLYYVYNVGHRWIVGSGTPKREYEFLPDRMKPFERPVVLPANAVVRKGETVTPDEAVAFGFIEHVGQKKLHDKRNLEVECKTCGS